MHVKHQAAMRRGRFPPTCCFKSIRLAPAVPAPSASRAGRRRACRPGLPDRTTNVAQLTGRSSERDLWCAESTGLLQLFENGKVIDSGTVVLKHLFKLYVNSSFVNNQSGLLMVALVKLGYVLIDKVASPEITKNCASRRVVTRLFEFNYHI